MNIHKKLNEWQENKLISAETARSIALYEDSQPRLTDHMWRYGLMGLAVLCVGLGLWFIIAANWQSIPFPVKLGAHTLFNIALAGIIVHMVRRTEKRKWALEIPVLLLSAAQLSLMALIGQYLQISSPFEDVMLYWWVLIAPLLLLVGQTFFSAMLFFGIGIYVLIAKLDIEYHALFIPIISGLTAFYLASFSPWLQRARAGWSQVMRNTGFWGLILLAIMLLIDADMFVNHQYRYFASRQIIIHIAGAALLTVATAAVYFKRRNSFNLTQYHAETEIVILSLGTVTLTQILLWTLSFMASNALTFCLYFLAFGWIAQRHRKRGLISLAILAIAIRMIVYFASLWNNLLMNGIAMIVIGCVALYAIRKLALKKGKTA